MVCAQQSGTYIQPNKFENDVEMYGAQTEKRRYGLVSSFENDVEMYGAQTVCLV